MWRYRTIDATSTTCRYLAGCADVQVLVGGATLIRLRTKSGISQTQGQARSVIRISFVSSAASKRRGNTSTNSERQEHTLRG